LSAAIVDVYPGGEVAFEQAADGEMKSNPGDGTILVAVEEAGGERSQSPVGHHQTVQTCERSRGKGKIHNLHPVRGIGGQKEASATRQGEVEPVIGGGGRGSRERHGFES
jgi:hypothetical protein